MITTYICDVCKCETEFTKKDHVMIDEDIRNKTNREKMAFNKDLKVYLSRYQTIISEYKLLIDEHNKKVHWWNLKEEWHLDTSSFAGHEIRIRENKTWSHECIMKEYLRKPYYNQRFYRYTECPVCGEKRYFK